MAATGAGASRIAHLARSITESVAQIDATLVAKGLPSLSFKEDDPSGYLPSELSKARDTALDAAAELYDLLLEPLHLIKSHGGSNNSVCLQAIARYGIADIVPKGTPISFAEIGRQTGLGEQMTTRLLRHAITMHIFQEPMPGFVAHTKASRLIASPQMRAWLTIGTHEMWPAATKMLDAREKWPDSQEPNETGFSLSQDSKLSIYDFVGSNPQRGARFAEAMAVWASRPDYAPIHAINGFDWGSLAGPDSKGRALVVDIGGAQGHVSVAIAQRFPHLDIVVQDMDEVINGAESGLPQELAEGGRVRFMAHDLFAVQPIRAKVYFLRWILHNWADKYSIAILRAQVPALEPGARIVIMETIMPDPGEQDPVGSLTPLWAERDLRAEDLNMAAVFNSRERTLQEWMTLLREADPRFVLQGLSKPEGSTLALIEAKWTP